MDRFMMRIFFWAGLIGLSCCTFWTIINSSFFFFVENLFLSCCGWVFSLSFLMNKDIC